jgi:hypothetical protein
MATGFEHTAHFTKPVATLHAALVSEQYWKDRMAEVGGPDARLVKFESNGGTDIDMVQTVDQKYLPEFVTKIRPGNLEIHRSEKWGGLTGDTATGTFVADVQGAPAKISGTTTLHVDGTGSSLTVHGEVEVRIPLLGGRVEEMIAEQLQRLMGKEDGFTQEWTDARP